MIMINDFRYDYDMIYDIMIDLLLCSWGLFICGSMTSASTSRYGMCFMAPSIVELGKLSVSPTITFNCDAVYYE